MLHLNDINKYLNCPYSYLYSKQIVEDKENRPLFLSMSESFNSCVDKKLKIDKYFEGQVGDSTDKTIKALKNNKWLKRARFEYNGLRVTVPLIHKVKYGIDVYFTKSIPFPKEDDGEYIANTLWVVKKCHIRVRNIYYIHFNMNYEREDKLDYDGLLCISDHLFNSKNRPVITIKEAVKKYSVDLNPIIEQINTLSEDNLPEKTRTNVCTRRYKCKYYDLCWSKENEEEDNSILHLASSENKYAMYQDGIRYLKDADLERIEGTRVQYAQIMADRNNGLYCDKNVLKNFLDNNIKYPVSFLDFEWDTYGIPPYEKMKPYEVCLFQYSLHILDSKDSEIRHEEYIGFNDCRKELLIDLLNKLPEEGSIVTFNGIGAENIRLKELGYYYPEYSEKINEILERTVDFSLPFSNGLVYHTKMRGLYSLKQIVEIFGEEASYHNLDIGKAMNAVEQWRKLSQNKENYQETLDNLYMYCGMDTYNLYLIYKWFIELVR